MTSPRAVLRSIAPALVALLLLPSLAVGHAELVESEPAAGGTLERTPVTLTATFSEPLDPDRSRIRVFDATNAEVTQGGVVSGQPERTEADLPELEPGAYAARWTAVGTDGHVERGAIEFTVAEASATPTPSPAPTVSPTTAPTNQPTLTPTGQPTATPPMPTASPVPSPSPAPTHGNGQPTAGTSDLLVALLVAAALVGGLLLFLARRRPA